MPAPSSSRVSLVFSFALSVSAVFACNNTDGPAGSSGDTDAHDIVQKGCGADEDCADGRCVDGLPEGLCTSNCVTHEDCPEGTLCTDTESPDGICLFTCANTDQCLDDVGSGYVCDTESDLVSGEDIRVCIDA